MGTLFAQPEVVVGLLVLTGVLITALATVAGALIAGRSSERAAYLTQVGLNVENLRRRAVSYEERIDALGLELEESRKDNLECIQERDVLKGRVGTLEERVAELENRQREQG